MSNKKIDSVDLISSFLKLGDSHRALREFLKTNKESLPRKTKAKFTRLHKELKEIHQILINESFDHVFSKKELKEAHQILINESFDDVLSKK